jgi:predicted nucleotidyltransferase component of viral defense system
MLNKGLHEVHMSTILREIYAEPRIASLLGFKGDTCAYFFHSLPRFSVDLDFDALETDEESCVQIFDTLTEMFPKRYTVKDSYRKRNTLFFLLSYGITEHNIKIEISARNLIPNLRSYFDIRDKNGIAMLVAQQPFMFASKLAALTLRPKYAMRDVFDVWYFTDKVWDMDQNILAYYTKKSIPDYLEDCVIHVTKIPDNQLLDGLGELITDKQKIWVKKSLIRDVTFGLKNYQAAFRKSEQDTLYS